MEAAYFNYEAQWLADPRGPAEMRVLVDWLAMRGARVSAWWLAAHLGGRRIMPV